MKIEQILDWIEANFDVARTGTNMPGPDLTEGTPFVWARFVGGPTVRLVDYPRLEVDVFGGSYRQAYDVAVGIQNGLLAAPVILAGAVIDTVDNPLRPTERPWPNAEVRRIGAEYELSARRR